MASLNQDDHGKVDQGKLLLCGCFGVCCKQLGMSAHSDHLLMALYQILLSTLYYRRTENRPKHFSPCWCYLDWSFEYSYNYFYVGSISIFYRTLLYGGHLVMIDNSVFVFRSILNSVINKMKTGIYLLILLPDKFGYPIIRVRVRVRSWPNILVNVVNTNIWYYLVKSWQHFWCILDVFHCIYYYQLAGINVE
jgi:hypothetical protein